MRASSFIKNGANTQHRSLVPAHFCPPLPPQQPLRDRHRGGALPGARAQGCQGKTNSGYLDRNGGSNWVKRGQTGSNGVEIPFSLRFFEVWITDALSNRRHWPMLFHPSQKAPSSCSLILTPSYSFRSFYSNPIPPTHHLSIFHLPPSSHHPQQHHKNQPR